MKSIIALTLLAASVSGCALSPNTHNSMAVRMATAPNQGSLLQGFLGGVRHGGLALAGAMSEDVYAEQHGLQPRRRMKPQQTDCSPDFNGGFTCVTREQ